MTSNGTCNNNSQCSGNGLCFDQVCSCLPLYEGTYCEIKQVDKTQELSDFFWIYCYVFGVVFFGVAVICVLQLALVIQEQGWKNVSKVTVMLYCLLFLTGIVRSFFLLFDPYNYRGMIGLVGFRILFGFPVACLMGVYLLIILLWINAYNATNYNKTLDRVFRYGWIAIVSLFVAEFVYDLINGFYGVGNIFWTTMIVYVVVIGVGALTLSILFLVYSHKLYHRLRSFKNEKLNQRKNLKKVTSFARVTTIMAIILVVGLGGLLALQILTQDPLVILIAQVFQRVMELCFCLLVIISSWKTFKKANTMKNDTQKSRLTTGSET